MAGKSNLPADTMMVLICIDQATFKQFKSKCDPLEVNLKSVDKCLGCVYTSLMYKGGCVGPSTIYSRIKDEIMPSFTHFLLCNLGKITADQVIFQEGQSTNDEFIANQYNHNKTASGSQQHLPYSCRAHH